MKVRKRESSSKPMHYVETEIYSNYVAIDWSSSVNYYDETALIIDFIDSGSNELVWRGTATGLLVKLRTRLRLKQILMKL